MANIPNPPATSNAPAAERSMGSFREITVGPSAADVVGTTNRAIQIAIDALGSRGGGTVRLLSGEYTCLDAVRLRPNIRLLGDREATVLRRDPAVTWSPLAVDAATSQTEVTPASTAGFRPGMGICTYDGRSGWVHTWNPRIVTEVRDGMLLLDGHLEQDRLVEAGGLVANHFPMILGIEADGAVVDGVTVDARVEGPTEELKRIRSAAVHFWRSKGVEVRNLSVRDALGDGICLSKSSVGGVIEDCDVGNSGMFGIHPGSYSARCAIRRCNIHDSAFDGLYICWGVQHGEFTDNHIHRNGWVGFRGGVSIGHQDTDALLARNHVHGNAKYGIAFREETEANGAHRATLRENVVEDNGSRPDQLADIKARLPAAESVGAGISVCGTTHDLLIENNTIRETRVGEARVQRHGIALHRGVSDVRLSGNAITGHEDEAVLDKHHAVQGFLECGELSPL